MKKPTHWIGSSRKSVQGFPKEVREEIGFSLYAAELGEGLINSVPLVGFGSAKVVEIIVPHDGDAYRAVYTVKFKEAVYVLHAFQKKSKKGSKTPLPDMHLIKARLRQAEEHYRAHYEINVHKGKKS
ncbi:MAG: type II toxin-antitoxin system RelE/ParE family toxin, partial [Alphaproteobacteria bacterium]|nr:type II toxin-antitoxin system RelE/ParE family toxin [Alphaproteobacteria bacterium]